MKFPKNTILEKAVLKRAKSVHAYCKDAGLDYPLVLKLIQLRDQPTIKNNKEKYRPICHKISLALNMRVEKLFPLEIYSTDYYAEQIKNAADASPVPDVNVTAAPRTAAPDEIYEAKERLKKAISRLSDREARFLMRYLFRGETLTEIGKAESVSPERARQIIKRAIGKIKKER